MNGDDMSKETGGPAFPIDRQTAHGIAISLVGSNNEAAYIEAVNQLSQGLTIRDYFAAKAMTAFIPDGRDDVDTARQSYAVADAMLEARK